MIRIRGRIFTTVTKIMIGNRSGIAMGESRTPSLKAIKNIANIFSFLKITANFKVFSVLSPKRPAKQEKSFDSS